MGSILKRVLESRVAFVPEGAVNTLLRVLKSFLPEPYERQDDAVVLGEILGVEEVGQVDNRCGNQSYKFLSWFHERIDVRRL